MTYVPEYLVREPGDPDLQSIYSAAGRINDNLDAIAAAISNAGGGILVTTLTGEADSLNAIDGDSLVGGETALAIIGSGPARVARYVLNASSGVPEDLPRVVTPITNPGAKRWELAGFLPYIWPGSAEPTGSDDQSTGVRQGDMWVYNGKLWICAGDGGAVPPDTGWSAALGSNFSGFPNYSVRQLVTSSASGDMIRVKIKSHTSGTLILDHLSIGVQDSDANTLATPVELQFGGSSGVTISGSEEWSDWVAFSVQPGANYIVVLDIGTNGDISYQAGGSQWKKAASDSWNLSSVSGFDAAAFVYCVAEIEVASSSNLALWILALTIGTGSDEACAGNDPRLSDARTPVAHGVTEHTGQTCVESQVGFTASGGHDHDGSNSTKIDHTDLLNNGTNDHAAIDTFIASKGNALGLSSLGADGKVLSSELPTIPSTAADVPVVATGFTGNLSSTDDDVQTALATIDAMATGESTSPGIISDGRLELNSSGASLKWDGYAIECWDGSSALAKCIPSSVPTFSNTGNDIFGNPLSGCCNYDVFFEYVNGTSGELKLVPWWGNSSTFADVLPWGTVKMTSNSAPSPNATAATSEYGGTYYAYLAFNRTNATSSDCWASTVMPTSGSPQRLMYDFGSGNARNVCGYRLQARNLSPTSYPKTWVFQGSSDASAGVDDAIDVNGWTTLDSRSNISSPAQAAWSDVYWCHTQSSYRKFRLVITDSNGATYVAIANVHFILGHTGATNRYRTWAASTLYPVGSVVFNSSDSHYYWCQTEHTSGASFDSQYWIDNGTDAGQPGLYKFQGRWVQSNSDTGKKRLWLGVVRPHASVAGQGDAWVTSTAYVSGDIRTVSSVVYICFKAHTSGAATQPGTGADWQTVWQSCGGSWDGRGVFEDSQRIRNISNCYNPKPALIGAPNPYTDATVMSLNTTWQVWPGNGDFWWVTQYVLCDPRNVVLDIKGPHLYSTTTSYSEGTGISQDNLSIPEEWSWFAFHNYAHAHYKRKLPAGFHFNAPISRCNTAVGSSLWQPYDTASSGFKASFNGEILA